MLGKVVRPRKLELTTKNVENPLNRAVIDAWMGASGLIWDRIFTGCSHWHWWTWPWTVFLQTPQHPVRGASPVSWQSPSPVSSNLCGHYRASTSHLPGNFLMSTCITTYYLDISNMIIYFNFGKGCSILCTLIFSNNLLFWWIVFDWFKI